VDLTGLWIALPFIIIVVVLAGLWLWDPIAECCESIAGKQNKQAQKYHLENKLILIICVSIVFDLYRKIKS
jgi:hypothetical protein